MVSAIFTTIQQIEKETDKEIIIEQVVNKIEGLTIREDEGYIKWPSIDLIKNSTDPDTCNFGLAHGMPSIITILIMN